MPVLRNERYQQGRAPALIVDVLETHFGSWFTVQQLAWEIKRIKPKVTKNAVHRAVQRMRREDPVPFESRLVDGDTGRGTPDQVLQLRVNTRHYYEEVS